MASKHPAVLNELKNFLQFLGEGKSCSLESVIGSSNVLIKECPPSREAVLQFYCQLFDDYCSEHCLAKVQSIASTTEGNSLTNIPIAGERVGPIISRFINAKNDPQPSLSQSQEVTPRKTSTESRRHSSESSNDDSKIAATPASPPHYHAADNSNSNDDLDCSAIMISLESQFNLIGDNLISIIRNEPNSFAKFIGEWALDLAAKLSYKYSRFISIISMSSNKNVSNEPKAALASSLNFWLQCPAMKLLIDLTIASTDSIEIDAILKQLLQFSPHSDWILAHLITVISLNSGFTTYIEQLMQSAASSTSVTCILSYLSEHNPRTIVNCSKSNIPFLLQLCVNSKPLLELLAIESTKQISWKILNELSASPQSNKLDDHIMYCFLNAPNSFELLNLAFDITTNSEASESLKTKTLQILNLIVENIHEFVYGSKLPFKDEPPILNLLKENIQGLVEKSIKTTDPFSRRLQLRLIHLLCMHYGIEFIPKVIHYILNFGVHQIDNVSYRTPLQSPLLSPLLKSLKMQFGAKVNQCINEALNIDIGKSVYFWSHLLAIIESDESIGLEVDSLTRFINADNPMADQKKLNHFYDYYIIRILLKTMEKFPSIVSKPRYRLCHYIAYEYFKLIKLQQESDEEEFDVYMESIVTCQKCLCILAKALTINQYILSRVMLELSMENSSLFCAKYTIKQVIDKNPTTCSLLKENSIQRAEHSSKFKKVALLSGKKEITVNRDNFNDLYLINQQLVLDAFNSCVTDIPAFCKLLVQSISPDLVYNDMPWPDEDSRDGQLQSLRITIERDLHVSRMFDSNPLLWNLCELIGKAGYLKNCLVIIRSLMSVQRTYWSSTTGGKENVVNTQKLLTLLSKNGILPDVPFKHIPSVIPQLQSWEVSCILTDICKYLKDSNSLAVKPPVKQYVERLRIIMAQNLPGPLFVKIFNGLK